MPPERIRSPRRNIEENQISGRVNTDQKMEKFHQSCGIRSLARSSSERPTGTPEYVVSRRKFSADDCSINFDFKPIACDCVQEECLDELTMKASCPEVHVGKSGAMSVTHLNRGEMSPGVRSPTLSTVLNMNLSPKSRLEPKPNDGSSPNTSCLSSLGPMCRICLEGDSQEELISPCRCTGSVALVHKSCLERWLNLSTWEKCELCSYLYTIERTPRPFWQFATCTNKEARRSAIVDLMCFLILTPLLLASVYFCISSIIHHAENRPLTSARKEHLQRNSVYWRTLIGRAIARENKNSALDNRTRDEYLDEAVGWDIIGLVVLTLILIGVYMLWLIAAIFYHVRMWQNWRLVNQNRILSENHRRPSRFSTRSNTYQHMDEIDSPDSFIIARSSVSHNYPTVIPYITIEDTDLPYQQNHAVGEQVQEADEKHLPIKCDNELPNADVEVGTAADELRRVEN